MLVRHGDRRLQRNRPSSTSSPMINGSVDQVDGLTVRGWATHPERQDDTAELDIYVDAVLIGRAAADTYRPDLHAAGIGTGTHGLTYELPGIYADGAVHRLVIQWRGTNMRLPGVDQFICDPIPSFAAAPTNADPRPYVLSRPLPEALAGLAEHRRIAVFAVYSTRTELWGYQLELLRALRSMGFAVV